MGKRLFDLLVSGCVMVLLSPLLLPLSIMLKLTGEGEIFYIQKRVGKGGKLFGLVKFATMLKDSPNLPGGDITTVNDPRLMPLGKFLRKTKLNELPQLWNIFKGDMSLVGPRPLTPRIFAIYPQELQKEICSVQPGLTGLGSIVFRDEEIILAKSGQASEECYRDQIAPYKGSLELWYIKNRSFMLDLKLLLLTAAVVICPGRVNDVKSLRGLPVAPEALRVLLNQN